MSGLNQSSSVPYVHLLSCIGISEHRAAQWDRAAISLESNPTRKTQADLIYNVATFLPAKA